MQNETPVRRPVLVVIGAGGMGRAIARRLGSGVLVLLADFDDGVLDAAARDLRAEGFAVEARHVDVADAASVAELAATADGLGPVVQVAHTAGLSPVQAGVAAITAVDLCGVALVLDAFERVIAPGGAGVVVASMAGAMLAGGLTAEQEHALATTPTAELGSLPFTDPERVTDPGRAYGIAKRGNHLRVRAAARGWGARGARINSISPGVISTPMGQQELDGASGAVMRAMVEASPTGRVGTPDDIAAAAAFLLGPDSTFVTGTDLLVDGGVVASISAQRAPQPA